MISIDPHGQWPLTVRNFYVVLIMTKLVQLESEGLEYYLLGFDQGGINADGKGWTDQNSDSRTGKVKFGITFNTKPIIVLPTCRIKYSKTESPVVVNVIHTSLNNSGFEYNADEVSGGEQSRTLEYIAIGI